MLGRKKFVPGVRIEEFVKVQSELPVALKLRIILCKVGDEIIGGTVFSAIGNTGLCLLAATTHKGRTLGASHLAWWKMLMWLQEKGYKLCDLGGIDAVEAPGPYHFKKGLNGFESRSVGFFYTSPGVLGDMLIGTAYRVKPLLRKAKGLKLKLHR
jgi:lipid II:glycine glycyltransferase (peptidoglycan interpeptide bridge formation enzyme)